MIAGSGHIRNILELGRTNWSIEDGCSIVECFIERDGCDNERLVRSLCVIEPSSACRCGCSVDASDETRLVVLAVDAESLSEWRVFAELTSSL